MTELILDGRTIQSREELHNVLSMGLGFPSYYGRNLDALYDCLTERGEETRLYLRNPELLPDAGKLLRVLDDAAAENPALLILTETEQG